METAETERLQRREELEAGPPPVGLCGCTVDLVTRAKRYCAAHQPPAGTPPQDVTPKGQATAAIERARRMLTPVREVGVLDAITLRGYLDYALDSLAKVEVLKKARPGEGKARRPATTNPTGSTNSPG